MHAKDTPACVMTTKENPTIGQLMRCQILENIGAAAENEDFVTRCWGILDGGSGDPRQFGDGIKGAVESEVERSSTGRRVAPRAFEP